MSRNNTFFDYAASFNKVDETLNVHLSGAASELPDGTYCRIIVRVPETGNGVITAEFSKNDVVNFRAFGSILIDLSNQGKAPNHLLVLIRNRKTGACELHDSNGSIERSWPESLATGLFKAFNSGLLAHLISGPGINDSNPFGVSFQSLHSGMQALEEAKTSVDAIKFLESNDVCKTLLSQKIRDRLVQYLTTGGFCATWSTLKVVDNAKTALKFCSVLENAFLHNNAVCQSAFLAAAKQSWFGLFKAEIEYTAHKEDTVIETLFNAMALSIFVRTLAYYFYRMFKANKHLGGASSKWWLDSVDAQSDVNTIMQKLIKHITPPTTYSFEQVAPSRFEGVHKKPTLMEYKKRFRVEKQICTAYELHRYLATRKSYFPFPPPPPDTPPNDLRVWAFSIDTNDPVRNTVEFYSPATHGNKKRKRNFEIQFDLTQSMNYF